jgi:uncharacterized membrane protein
MPLLVLRRWDGRRVYGGSDAPVGIIALVIAAFVFLNSDYFPATFSKIFDYTILILLVLAAVLVIAIVILIAWASKPPKKED